MTIRRMIIPALAIGVLLVFVGVLARLPVVDAQGDITPTPRPLYSLPDPNAVRVYHSNVIALTAKEYELLELFLRHPRQVLTRDMIFDRVWGYDFGGESNIIEVYIRYLRQKLEAEDEPRLIHTVRGMGYVLREPS